MNEIELQQIFALLQDLIESGRLTLEDNQLKVDGLVVMDPDAANVVIDTPTGYDDNGIGLTPGAEGGLRLRAVDERITQDRASSDTLLQKVANAFPQFFFINVDRGQSDEEAWQRNSNYNKHSWLSAWAKRYIKPAYRWADAKWVHKITDAVLNFQFFLTNTQHFSREWKKSDDWDSTLGVMENHLTYSMGVVSLNSHPDYNRLYLAQAERYALEHYEGKLAAARKAALPQRGTPAGRIS